MSIEQLARDAYRVAEPSLDPALARDIADDLDAGEYVVAMVTLVESAPTLVTAEDVAELDRLADNFDEVDGPIARRVVANVRQSPLLSA